jgi:two-component system chemotaxis response regulator CheY
LKRHRPIIVAESDFLTGTLLIASLESAGRLALIARDGETVLELIAAHEPHLLVLSMNLARPGGVQMLRTLHQKRVSVNILATTRIGQANIRATARALGVSVFLELPFFPDELNQKVERMLAAAS